MPTFIPSISCKLIPVAVIGVSVIHANAQPVFGPPMVRVLGVSEPEKAIVADFDQNGHMDIAVSGSGGSNNSGEMIILLSDGSGTFPNEETIPGPAYGFGVGDVNHDGILDVVTPSHNRFNPPYFVQVFTGDGGGGMVYSSFYLTNSAPYDACIGDFNGDGWDDIIAGGEIWDAEILLNNGDGTFAPAVRIGNDHNIRPTRITAADFNNDGNLDFFITGIGAREYLGNGDGTFTIPSFPFGTHHAAGQTLRDMNNDGIPDSVVEFDPQNGSGLGRVLVSLGNPDGSFQNQQFSQSISVFPNRPVDADATDFDNDGFPDVVALANNGAGSGPTIFLGNGDGTLEPASVFINIGSDESMLVVAGDFNEDGWPDLFVPSRAGGDEAIAQIYFQIPPAGGCQPDLTGDGILDFFDVQAFLQAFATQDPIADFTADGVFDFFDVQAFLQAFATGCP